MDADEVIVEECDGQGVAVVFQFLTVRVGLAGVAAVAHAQGEVGALDHGGADVPAVRVAVYLYRPRAGALGDGDHVGVFGGV